MGILDMTKKNGELKGGKALADAIHFTDIQRQLNELSWDDFLEIVHPIIEKHQQEAGE